MSEETIRYSPRFTVMSGAPYSEQPKTTFLMTQLQDDKIFKRFSSKYQHSIRMGRRDDIIESGIDLMDMLKAHIEAYQTIKSFDWTGVDKETIKNILCK